MEKIVCILMKQLEYTVMKDCISAKRETSKLDFSVVACDLS